MAQKAIETVGIIAFLMMQSRVHQGLTLAQMGARCLPAVNAGLAVTASAPVKGEDGAPGPDAPIGFALFARVSDAWDAKLRDPDFDLNTLPADAWNSGPHQWMVDIVVAQKAAATFGVKAAASVFPNGSALHIRLPDPAGKITISEAAVGGQAQ